MFERYTEGARRTIFFARHEANTVGSPFIESEHLLLALLREDRSVHPYVAISGSVDWVRPEVERRTGKGLRGSSVIDLPLSNECKRILAYANEEAERLGSPHIGNEHLLLGIFREEKSFGAEILRSAGFNLGKVREAVGRMPVARPSIVGSSQPVKLASPGHAVPTVAVADLAASKAFYSKLGLFPIGGSQDDGILVLSNGHSRLAIHASSLAPTLLCFYGADLEALAKHAGEVDLVFERPPGPGPHGSVTAQLRDPDGTLIYFISARP